MSWRIAPWLFALALAGGCAFGTKKKEWDPLDPKIEYVFMEGGRWSYEVNDKRIVDIKIRNHRLIYNGHDLCAYADRTPVHFLPDGDLLVGGKRVSTKGARHPVSSESELDVDVVDTALLLPLG